MPLYDNWGKYKTVPWAAYGSYEATSEAYPIALQTGRISVSGTEGMQLTWMDAKVKDWVVTPRTGKAVEINALWYNALKIMACLAREMNLSNESIDYRALAQKVSKSLMMPFGLARGDTSMIISMVKRKTRLSALIRYSPRVCHIRCYQ